MGKPPRKKPRSRASNRDVDFDTKVRVVVEMKLFRQGKSSYRSVAALAKDIA